MDKKKLYIGIAIGIIIVIGVVVLYFYRTTTNNATNQSNLNNQTQEDTITDTGGMGVEYSDDQLTNFDFQIKGITQELNSKIENPSEFYLAIKRYAYEKGLVTASEAEVKKFKQDGNELKIRFNLNDDKETKIIAIINTTNNKYEFYYYQ